MYRTGVTPLSEIKEKSDLLSSYFFVLFDWQIEEEYFQKVTDEKEVE